MANHAKLVIHGDRVRKGEIQPFLFGHFVEDIRDHMDAMLAFPLKTMDFEKEAEFAPGVSGEWMPITNGKNTAFSLEPPAPRHSGHSQKIRIASDDRCYAGIAQRVSVRGGIRYEAKLFARATREIESLRLAIVDRITGKTLGEAEVAIESHDWREYKTEIRVSAASADAEFRLTISSEEKTWKDSISTGALWLDHVSLLPEDHVGLVKPDVFEMTKRLNAGMMRLGGNYISAYHWRQGVGPAYERPNVMNEAWDHQADKYFGTIEFLEFCERLGVEPLICVNDGSGTPEEAAEWIRYCNADAETDPLGALRASHGRVEPFRAKYWEIGNEVWGPWQVGHCDAEEYAHRLVAFAKGMKAVDPELVLLGCGHTDDAWNRTVLDIAGEHIDYLTMHIYQHYSTYGYPGRDAAERAPAEEKFRAIVSYPEVSRYAIRQAADAIRSSEKARHVKLAITEYNTMYYPNTIRQGLPNEHTLEAAVANAANLNEMIRSCDIVEIGSFSDLVNGWLGGCIRVGDNYADQKKGRVPGWSGKGDLVYGTPTYYALELFANADIARVVEHELSCDTFDAPKHAWGVPTDGLPTLDVVCCISRDGRKLTALVVNRSLEDVDAELRANGFEAAPGAVVREIAGDRIDLVNDVFEPEAVVSRRFEAATEGSGALSLRLKAHSIYAVELTAAQ
ncbi:alpha-L-arabinofuranosidase C-terminal domain-containing protein [Paenibacillus antri]|nr:alpha-L-arabinofuranosidase C-terminal domain-containing protein [Paenibacillus antri]